MAQLSAQYEARCPAGNVLYQIVQDHFETFRAQATSLRDGEGLPRFVEQEFRDFLQCGWLAGGFARFRCGGCGLDRLGRRGGRRPIAGLLLTPDQALMFPIVTCGDTASIRRPASSTCW